MKIAGIFENYVKKEIVAMFRKQIATRALDIYKESIEKVEAVDTATLKQSLSIVTSDTKISFYTNTNYADFVILGLGTNRKYGARQFPTYTVMALKSLVENGNYNLPRMKGARK